MSESYLYFLPVYIRQPWRIISEAMAVLICLNLSQSNVLHFYCFYIGIICLGNWCFPIGIENAIGWIDSLVHCSWERIMIVLLRSIISSVLICFLWYICIYYCPLTLKPLESWVTWMHNESYYALQWKMRSVSSYSEELRFSS